VELFTDEKALSILEIVSNGSEPIGSWNLVELLEKRGISVSPATIGRMLNRLEKLGYLRKEKLKGRVITSQGMEAIRIAKELQRRKHYQEELDRLIDTETLEDFLMVLEARKIVESATARLAAQNITEGELSKLEEILNQQRMLHERSESVTDTDIAFHRAIAAASRNKVLENIYKIISLSGQQSELFEYIRSQVGAPYMTSHLQIFDALNKRDPEKAEMSMIRHMDSLIEDVRSYWHIYYPEVK